MPDLFLHARTRTCLKHRNDNIIRLLSYASDLLIVETRNTKQNRKQTKTVLIRYMENPTPRSWCGMDSPHRRPVMQKGSPGLSSSYFTTSVEP